jgi:hypothetical protein
MLKINRYCGNLQLHFALSRRRCTLVERKRAAFQLDCLVKLGITQIRVIDIL